MTCVPEKNCNFLKQLEQKCAGNKGNDGKGIGRCSGFEIMHRPEHHIPAKYQNLKSGTRGGGNYYNIVGKHDHLDHHEKEDADAWQGDSKKLRLRKGKYIDDAHLAFGAHCFGCRQLSRGRTSCHTRLSGRCFHQKGMCVSYKDLIKKDKKTFDVRGLSQEQRKANGLDKDQYDKKKDKNIWKKLNLIHKYHVTCPDFENDTLKDDDSNQLYFTPPVEENVCNAKLEAQKEVQSALNAWNGAPNLMAENAAVKAARQALDNAMAANEREHDLKVQKAQRVFNNARADFEAARDTHQNLIDTNRKKVDDIEAEVAQKIAAIEKAAKAEVQNLRKNENDAYDTVRNAARAGKDAGAKLKEAESDRQNAIENATFPNEQDALEAAKEARKKANNSRAELKSKYDNALAASNSVVCPVEEEAGEEIEKEFKLDSHFWSWVGRSNLPAKGQRRARHKRWRFKENGGDSSFEGGRVKKFKISMRARDQGGGNATYHSLHAIGYQKVNHQGKEIMVRSWYKILRGSNKRNIRGSFRNYETQSTEPTPYQNKLFVHKSGDGRWAASGDYLHLKENHIGSAYQGKQNKTKSGKTCQNWNEQRPHRHGVVKNGKVHPHYAWAGEDADKDWDHNYCRRGTNPKPWCYTTHSRKRWEYCKAPHKDDSKENKAAFEAKDECGKGVYTGYGETYTHSNGKTYCVKQWRSKGDDNYYVKCPRYAGWPWYGLKDGKNDMCGPVEDPMQTDEISVFNKGRQGRGHWYEFRDAKIEVSYEKKKT